MHIQGKNTIYINNLNEKVKIADLKKALHAVFGQFGEIISIDASRNLKMRGQAFVAFKKEEGAAAAITKMQGFPFFDKPLKIQVAKCDSDSIAKLLGTYNKREKKFAFSKKYEKKVQQVLLPLANQPPPPPPVSDASYIQANKPLNIPSGALLQNLPQIALPSAPPNYGEPPRNNILYLTNLPPHTNQMLLSAVFGKFPGFNEIRTVHGRPEIAFVEFFDELSAEVAKNSIQGFKLGPSHAINISFAKK